jgi:hypothetical protein
MGLDAFKQVDELLQLLVGHLVWSVRKGVGTGLSMQFGEPHRVVRGPGRASEDASPVVRKILNRRLITIKGDLTLSILDAKWSIFTRDKVVNWESSEELVNDMLLYHLDGQKLLSANRRVDDTVFEFDFGTSMRLQKSIFPTDMASVLWVIKRCGSESVGLFNSGSAIPPNWRYGDEIDWQPDLPPKFPPSAS